MMTIRMPLFALLLAVTAPVRADLVLVAHPGFAVGSLPLAHVSRLFFGQSAELPDGARVVALDVAGPAKDSFTREVLKKTPAQVEKYWARMIFTGKAKPPRAVKPGEVKALVASTPGALSYIERSQVDATVKVIDVIAR